MLQIAMEVSELVANLGAWWEGGCNGGYASSTFINKALRRYNRRISSLQN